MNSELPDLDCGHSTPEANVVGHLISGRLSLLADGIGNAGRLFSLCAFQVFVKI